MLAVIGGSLLYRIPGLEILDEHDVATPFGKPSAAIIEGRFKEDGKKILFLPRHGTDHHLLPSEVNYRANVFALKKLGATKIVGTSAVGSLREDLHPGDLCLISQYFDHTRGQRQSSFFGHGVVAHVSTAEPACPALSRDIAETAKALDLPMATGKTYGCIEGPRFGTRAESAFLRLAGCDVVGMTNVPEAFLAREAQMAYCTIGIVTDYDCWMEDPEQHAQADEMIKIYKANIDKINNLIRALSLRDLSGTGDDIRSVLKFSLVTPREKVPPEHENWLGVLES